MLIGLENKRGSVLHQLHDLFNRVPLAGQMFDLMFNRVQFPVANSPVTCPARNEVDIICIWSFGNDQRIIRYAELTLRLVYVRTGYKVAAAGAMVLAGGQTNGGQCG